MFEPCMDMRMRESQYTVSEEIDWYRDLALPLDPADADTQKGNPANPNPTERIRTAIWECSPKGGTGHRADDARGSGPAGFSD